MQLLPWMEAVDPPHGLMLLPPDSCLFTLRIVGAHVACTEPCHCTALRIMTHTKLLLNFPPFHLGIFVSHKFP